MIQRGRNWTVPELLQRLHEIGERLAECPAPNVYDGNDLCPCGTGQVWPCRTTEAAWLAQGKDIDIQQRKILAELTRVVDLEEDDDMGCQGHPAGPFDPMGVTVYCDGTCQR